MYCIKKKMIVVPGKVESFIRRVHLGPKLLIFYLCWRSVAGGLGAEVGVAADNGCIVCGSGTLGRNEVVVFLHRV